MLLSFWWMNKSIPGFDFQNLSSFSKWLGPERSAHILSLNFSSILSGAPEANTPGLLQPAEQTLEAREGLVKPSLNQVNGADGSSKVIFIWLSGTQELASRGQDREKGVAWMVSLCCVRQGTCSFMDLFHLIFSAVLDRECCSPLPLPFYRWEHWHLRKLRHLPKISWLLNDSEPRSVDSKPVLLTWGLTPVFCKQVALIASKHFVYFMNFQPFMAIPAFALQEAGKGPGKMHPPSPTQAQLPSQRSPSSHLALAPLAS